MPCLWALGDTDGDTKIGTKRIKKAKNKKEKEKIKASKTLNFQGFFSILSHSGLEPETT